MSATDYLARSVHYDIAEEALADARDDWHTDLDLPSPDELGCTDRPGFCGRACYCARLAKAARR